MPIERPLSAGSHASVDSQDSSLSWLLSLERKRSHHGHTTLTSLYQPESFDHTDEEILKGIVKPLPTDVLKGSAKGLLYTSPVAQTAAERKEMKAKATEALLKKYKDSPYSRMPLPSDLRKELVKQSVVKGQLPLKTMSDKGEDGTRQNVDNEKEDEMLKISKSSFLDGSNKHTKMSTNLMAAQEMLETYKTMRVSDIQVTPEDNLDEVFAAVRAEAKQKEEEHMIHFLKPQVDRKKWNIPKVQTTQEAGKEHGEWKPFCGTEAIKVPGQRLLRFKGKGTEVALNAQVQRENPGLHYEPINLSKKLRKKILSENDPLYRITREEISNLLRKVERNEPIISPFSQVAPRHLSNSLPVSMTEAMDVVAVINESDITILRQTRIPSPKEWVVLRVVYFLLMAYFEQVIEKGSFNSHASALSTTDDAISDKLGSIKSQTADDDATEESGESLEVHQVHATEDGLIGEIFRQDELGKFWKILRGIRKRHGLSALNSVDTFNWEDMQTIFTHARAFIGVLQHIEVGQEGNPALLIDTNESDVTMNTAECIQEKYDTSKIFPRHWKSGQFYRSFKETHYDKLALVASSSLLHPSFTVHVSPTVSHLCKWARRVIAGLFLARATLNRFANKIPLAPIESEAPNSGTYDELSAKETQTGDNNVKSSTQPHSTSEITDNTANRIGLSHLVGNEAYSLASECSSNADLSLASSVLFEAIINVKSTMTQRNDDVNQMDSSNRVPTSSMQSRRLKPSANTKTESNGWSPNRAATIGKDSLWTAIRKVERFVASSTLQADFEGFYEQVQASMGGGEAKNLVMALDKYRSWSQLQPLYVAVLVPICISSASEPGFTDTSSFFAGMDLIRPNDTTDIILCRYEKSFAPSSEIHSVESECTSGSVKETGKLSYNRSYCTKSYYPGLFESYLTRTSKSPLHTTKLISTSSMGCDQFDASRSVDGYSSNDKEQISFCDARATFTENRAIEMDGRTRVLQSPMNQPTTGTGNAKEGTNTGTSTSELMLYLHQTRPDSITIICKDGSLSLAADENTIKFISRISYLNLLIVPQRVSFHGLDTRQRTNTAAKYVICVSSYKSSKIVLNLVLRIAKPSDVILLTHFVSRERQKLPDTQHHIKELVREFKTQGFNVLVEYEQSIQSMTTDSYVSSSPRLEQNRRGTEEQAPTRRSYGNKNKERGNAPTCYAKAQTLVESVLAHEPTYICIACTAFDVEYALRTDFARTCNTLPKSMSQAIYKCIATVESRTAVTNISMVPTAQSSFRPHLPPNLLMVATNSILSGK